MLFKFRIYSNKNKVVFQIEGQYLKSLFYSQNFSQLLQTLVRLLYLKVKTNIC